MTVLEKAARQALEALEDIFGKEKKDVGAINALRQALEQPKQEPVAWINCNVLTGKLILGWECESELASEPLYTSPPAHSWVGLTDKEVRTAYCTISDKEWAIGGMEDATKFTRAIEAKLKEKNT